MTNTWNTHPIPAWTYFEQRHVWVKFHHYIYDEKLIIVDLLAVEAVEETDDGTVLRTADNVYRIFEDVAVVMKTMNEYLGKELT